MSIHIKNGRIINPSCERDETGDIFIEDGRIVPALSGTPATVIDADGKWVVPGLMDVHVHLREPGQEHKETIETGTQAAAAGGFTTVVAMPNTSPCADTADVVNGVMDKARALGGTRVVQSCAISKNRQCKELTDFAGLKNETGVTIFTDDGDGIDDDALMKEAFLRAKELDIVLCQHSEMASISKKAAIHDGAVAAELKVAGQPIASEDDMVIRDIELLKQVGGKLHISHISSKNAVEAVRQAKAAGLAVTAEVTPHHLHLTDDTVYEAGTIAKVAPPLRPFEHVEACRAGLADGTIDLVATDHAPHTLDDKSGDLNQAAFGMVGLEIALPLLLELVAENVISPARLVDAMSCGAHRIFGLPGGTLAVGAVADVTIVDPDDAYEIDPRTFKSKGINTPFAGRRVRGRAACTIVDGSVVFSL